MADLEMEVIAPVGADSELLNRPDKTLLVRGQAGFLAVALNLQIPILNSGRNIDSLMSPSNAGAGASFAVSTFVDELTTAIDVDFVNGASTSWFTQANTERRSVSLRYVSKRILTASDPGMDDSRQLASIVNEMRILSNRTLRASRNIVSLLCVSWFELPSHGRFWPQVLLESARFGTLENFISSTQRSFQTKVSLGLDIISGLNFLHIHGIVHCDVKPSNVLVFADSTYGAEGIDIESIGIDPVAAKICDFGCSVILTDYDSNRPFQARIGTFPWMSPELELSLPIEIDLLHKTDIFSFGLLMASVFMNGCKPYQNMSSEEVTATKLDEVSGWNSVLDEVKTTNTLSDLECPFVSMLLIQTLLPNPDHRFNIESITGYLKLALLMACSTRNGENVSSEEEQNSSIAGARKSTIATSNNLLEEPPMKLSWAGSLRAALHKAGRAIGDLSRLNSDRQNQDSLLEAFFGKRYIQPDSFPRFKDPVGARVEEDTSNATNAHWMDDEEYDPNNHFISTVPDLCFEYGFRPGLLPAVAAKEVFNDLKMQAIDMENCSSDVLYALSGCYINENITSGDLDLGLHFLAQAAIKGHFGAIATVRNIFSSCDRTLPDGLTESVSQRIADTGPHIIMSLVSESRASTVPWKVNRNRIQVESWCCQFPKEYDAFVKSDLRRNIQASLILYMNISLETVESRDQRKTPFDFSSLRCWEKDRAYLRASELDIGAFVNEVQKLHCTNHPNKWGLTLLQEAVAHQDYAMANLLVDRLSADVNSFGNTPGWTPLWLCCLSGQFDMAVNLLRNGAIINCKDLETGATILHTINQFAEVQQIEAILKLVLVDNNCMNIECTSTSGMTPLHSTFTGWDFSRGAAARTLLTMGANPTAKAPDDQDFSTPIGLCVLRLDVALLECMLRSPWVSERKGDTDASKAIARAKAQAFRSLIGQTQFYFRAVMGKDWTIALRSVLQLIVDEEMLREFDQSPLVNPEAGLLRTVLMASRTYIAEALFTPFPLLDLTRYSSGGRPILHVAIERRLQGCVRLLIRLGLNILEKDHQDETALHAAAHHFPAMLIELIEAVERMEPQQRGGLSMKQILETPSSRGFDVIGLLLAEGYTDEIRIAKDLRAKYRLELDAMRPMEEIDEMTLTGAMIVISMGHGLIPTEQFQYLLDLLPRPRFVCSRSGRTLLEFAVTGINSDHRSLDNPNHHLVQMILQRYPERENLLLGPRRVGAIYRAAIFANLTAIEMMQNHINTLNRRKPPQAIPFHTILNTLTEDGDTVLDYAASAFRALTSVVSYDHLHKVKYKDRLMSYKYLRTQGALHSFELQGVFMRARMLYSNLISLESWQGFIKNAIRELNISETTHELPLVVMSHSASDPEVLQAIEANPSMADTICKMRVIQLVWLFDGFCFRIFEFVFSPFQVKEHMKAFMDSTSRDRGWLRCYRDMNPDDEPWPWLRTTYTQHVPGANENITWTRPGRIWTSEEASELCTRFGQLWTESFGSIEDRMVELGSPILVQKA